MERRCSGCAFFEYDGMRSPRVDWDVSLPEEQNYHLTGMCRLNPVPYHTNDKHWCWQYRMREVSE